MKVRDGSQKVPQTPRARPIKDISIDATERFVGIIWVSKDDGIAIEDYLIEYDFYEKYSETKTYSKRPYIEVYNGEIRKYNNYLCIFKQEEQEDEYYVLARRCKNELKELEPYCQCSICSSYNPFKYLKCKHCVGCIKAGYGFANQTLIKNAKLLKESPITTISWTTFFQNQCCLILQMLNNYGDLRFYNYTIKFYLFCLLFIIMLFYLIF